jgi:hypothetical protein
MIEESNSLYRRSFRIVSFRRKNKIWRYGMRMGDLTDVCSGYCQATCEHCVTIKELLNN